VGAAPVVVGVVGSPVGHSLSPLLHQAAFDALGLDWRSLAFEVPAGGGAGVVSALRALSMRGLSVTMPLKEEVAEVVDRLEPQAALLGSVNCLSLEDGAVVGLSTDGDGLLACLERVADFRAAGARCLVAGAGAAARSVVAALSAAGALEVAIVARHPEQAERAAGLAGAAGRVGDATDAAVVDLVVDTTPVGMAGTASEHDLPLIDPALLGPLQLAVDLVYEPRRTPWLEAAAAGGARTVGGLGMLVHQAALQVERWTGLAAPVDAMWAAAEGQGPG
jgi:shikimate dehydrogenase